jgi:HlyD family secretion protein
MENNRLPILAVSAICVLFSAGCRRAQAADEAAFQGTVELDEWVLGFEVPGRVASVEVERGGVVEAGARIAFLDRALETTVRAARQSEAEAAAAELALLKAGSRSEEVRSMDAQVRAAKATEDLLARNLAREEALFGRGATTPAAVDDLKGRLDVAVAQREALEQKLRELKRGSRAEEVSAAAARASGALAAAKLEDERLARHELLAPARAVVLDVHVKAGEVVQAGTPVATLGDTRHPYADVFVPEPKLSGLAAGVAADVRVDGEPRPFRGVIETMGRKLEFTPRFLFSTRVRPNLVLRVRVRIDDPEERLHAGAPAFVTFRPGAR